MDWTEGDEMWRAMHYGESKYDPRPPDEPEDRPDDGPDEPEAVEDEPERVALCADCGRELYRYRPRHPLPPMGAVLHECAAQRRANRAARRRGAG